MSTSHDIESYPLTSPEFFEAPYPTYHRMRQHDPVYWSKALRRWVLTRYDDVLAAFRNPAISNVRIEVFVQAQLRDSDPALAAEFSRIMAGTKITKDGQDHHRLRVLGNPAFSPSTLQRWLPRIERVVEERLDPDRPFSGIRLSDKNSRLRPRKASRAVTQADQAQHVVQVLIGKP